MAHRQLEITNVAEEGPQNELFRYRGKINGYPVLILLDCGSTHDLISLDFVQRHKIVTRKGDGHLTLTMADGHACTESLTRTDDLGLILPDLHERMMFTVFPLAKYDAILGKPWLAKNNPSINGDVLQTEIRKLRRKRAAARWEVRNKMAHFGENPSERSAGGP